MKVIFLDIDGVLNVYCESRDKYGCTFHAHLCDNLRSIIDATDAKIVISSTWRMNGLRTMQAMWHDRGLAGEVIDVTPDCYQIVEQGDAEFYDMVERGHEIQDWLNRHPEVTQYVILDDDRDMLQSQEANFVQTAHNKTHEGCIDIGYGLTKICAQRAIEILNS